MGTMKSYVDHSTLKTKKTTTANGGKSTRKHPTLLSGKIGGGNVVDSRLNNGGDTKWKGTRGTPSKVKY